MQTISENLLEVPMNMNPWMVERMVEYERDRIRSDMKQIHLEEEAIQAGRTEEKTTKTRLYRLRLVMRIVPTLVQGMFCVGKQTH
jgi:hypothetical protein